MTKEHLLSLVGDFTWFWGQTFFIETSEGNFIWSDPDYNGDNTIRSTNESLEQYCKNSNVPCGRDKGTHVIENYCGKNVIFK